MSNRAPMTCVPEAGWTAISHVTPLKSKILFIRVETGSCFQQQG